MKLRAAVLNEENVMPRIETVTLADPAEGQVRVKVMAAGVCHSDLSAVRGVIPQTMPLVLGHEGAGIVEAVGEGVTRVAVGDHVIFSWVPSCGECYFCQHERPDMCDHAFMLATLGTLPDGTTPFSRPVQDAPQDGETEDLYIFSQTSCLAEYTVVPEKGVVPIGKDVPFEVAAITGCAVMTGVGAALKSAQLTPGRHKSSRWITTSANWPTPRASARPTPSPRLTWATPSAPSSTSPTVWAWTTPSRWWAAPRPFSWPTASPARPGKSWWWGWRRWA